VGTQLDVLANLLHGIFNIPVLIRTALNADEGLLLLVAEYERFKGKKRHHHTAAQT
jgi:hypothetical protein